MELTLIVTFNEATFAFLSYLIKLMKMLSLKYVGGGCWLG